MYPIKQGRYYEFNQTADVQRFISENNEITFRGNGRSYGDSALGDKVLSSLSFQKIIMFDEAQGIIECESGVLLDELLQLIVPHGFFLPVTPGTKFITVGGALASDIHGKNHHVDGVFSDHVASFTLIDANGQLVEVLPNTDLFYKTAGGMGSTGFIQTVKFGLKKIETSYIRQINVKAANLAEIFEHFEQYQDYTYSVAWIDCLKKGKNMGRSILMLGEHATAQEVTNRDKLLLHKKPFLNIPFSFPNFVLNTWSVAIFNWLYFHNPLRKIGKTHYNHYDGFFYPLDKIHNWNRIYGKQGFMQYQFVLPKEKSYEGVKKILTLLAENKKASFLAVLKLFGKSHEDRYLHFPMEGYTLAVDIKYEKSTLDVLEACDQVVNELGGKVYLTKDARMSTATYENQYVHRPLIGKFTTAQFDRLQHEKQQKLTMKKLLVLGANSDMAKACILAWHQQNHDGQLILASRNLDDLQAFVAENNLNTVATTVALDLEDINQIDHFVQQLSGGEYEILYAAGNMYANDDAMLDSQKIASMIQVNYQAPALLLSSLLAKTDITIRRIVGMSSLAGLRGRKSNFMYGATKAGFHQFLFGLRQQLAAANILVQAITPGFVNTKLTAGMKLGKLANQPEDIARLFMKKTNSFELYPSLPWRIISLIVKYAPEFVIRKL